MLCRRRPFTSHPLSLLNATPLLVVKPALFRSCSVSLQNCFSPLSDFLQRCSKIPSPEMEVFSPLAGFSVAAKYHLEKEGDVFLQRRCSEIPSREKEVQQNTVSREGSLFLAGWLRRCRNIPSREWETSFFNDVTAKYPLEKWREGAFFIVVARYPLQRGTSFPRWLASFNVAKKHPLQSGTSFPCFNVPVK